MSLRGILGLLVMALFGVASCAIPGAGSLDLSGCTRTCNGKNKVCLDDTGVSCEPATTCFDNLETCFDGASDCSYDCRGCEDDTSCEDEAACNYACEDLAHQCLNSIDTCVDLQVSCVEGKADNSLDCVYVLVECIATCVEETEDQLKGKSND